MDCDSDDGTMKIAALGRPFGLGMLYDSRRDAIIPGLTLWDHHVLEEDIGDRPQPHSDFEIVASDSIEEKTSVLKVKGSLKASFLSGLVDVGGSAKYLNETKASKNQARVTLHYRATTRFRELSMNHLGEAHVQHSDIFDTSLATHVVTAILYGAQAFFVFDRDVTEKENHTDIQGDLQVMIEKIPNASIGGKGSVQVEEEHKTTVNKFSCRFYGDFCLQNPPTTFQGAVEVYRSLPKLLGPNGENAVPMKVWLLPLSFLDSNAAKLVRQISIALIQEVENILEDFIELETRCNDVLRTTVAQQFPEIGKDLRNFKNMSYQFKLEFQQSLAKQLPSIRGGGEEEAELAGILKMRCTSPFNRKNMTEWIDSKEREIYTLMSFTGMMKNTKIIQSLHDLYKESLKVKHVLCFVFTALGTTEPYLTALSDYLKDRTKKGSNHHPCSYDVEQDQWYTSKEIVDEMRIKAKLFGEFADANKENEDIRFLTVGLTNEKHRGSSIYFYKDGFSLSNNFMPPSEPETVTVGDMNHISVTLKISPPRYGAENVTSYSVEYRVRGEDGWKLETHLKSEEITVRDLRPNTEYEFRCRAIISAGVGPASKVSIRTEPCSPPGKPHVEPYEREILVSWKKPAEIGQNVQIIGYIVEYTTIPEEDLNVEALQWNQVRSITEKVIISELEPGTEYLVRLFWDFGAGSRSKESVTVNVTTKSSQCHKEFIKRTGKMTKSGSPSVYKLRLTKDDMNIDGCRRFIFGAECTAPNRTIMLFGGTGSEKSALINGMINYIIGIEWEDKFRVKLLDNDQSNSKAQRQNTEVTVYKINHQDGFKIPFSLTIIDTPVFEDTRGTERDKMITEHLCNLIAAENGVGEVDAVGFVVQAALTQLTPTQKYIFDTVISVFSDNVEENIRVLVTSTNHPEPSALEAIKVSGVRCPKTDDDLPVHFKFNNSALFAQKKPSEAHCMRDDEEGSFDEIFWSIGANTMKNFFGVLDAMEPKDLSMTKEVLRERKKLTSEVESLQEKIKNEIANLVNKQEIIDKRYEYKSQISKNPNFEYEISVMKPYKDYIDCPGYFLNCQLCHVTCYKPLPAASQSDAHGCDDVELDGTCTMCPGKCHIDLHFLQKYRWEYQEVKEKLRLSKPKHKYSRMEEDETDSERMKRSKSEGSELREYLRSSAECLNKLQESSHKHHLVKKYIDKLIEGEEHEKKAGWKRRVDSLIRIKTGGFPPVDFINSFNIGCKVA